MATTEPTILCKTPTPGKKGTRIAKWKYDCIQKAIKKCTPKTKSGIAFKDMPKLVEKHLSAEERKSLGSITWYTVTVKLDMEVRGELCRVPGVKPQHIRRV